MNIARLYLTDFRNYASAGVSFTPEGLTAIIGANGEGKSNLIEALSFVTTRKSFRGATNESLVRVGAERAIVRADALQADGREMLVEMEVPPSGRVRMQVNRQNVGRMRDLLEMFSAVVFSPDDLVLVKGGPGERRDWLDDLLAFAGAKYSAIIDDVEHILKQRNALLRNHEGYLSKSERDTLDVFDEQFANVGEVLVNERLRVLSDIEPYVVAAYDALAETSARVSLAYESSWGTDLGDALTSARDADVRRRTSTVGPHRDDIAFSINDMPARTHASQGEQRSLVLALRLAAHHWLTDVRHEAPLLLLDDVFSELDESRRRALVAHLPKAQTILTSAADIPFDIVANQTLHVQNGTIS